MTKGVLGERVWLAKSVTSIPAHHVKMGRLLNSVPGAGVVILIYGLWHLDLGVVFCRAGCHHRGETLVPGPHGLVFGRYIREQRRPWRVPRVMSKIADRF